LHCLSFFWFIASDYNFGIFKLVLKFHIYVLYFVLLPREKTNNGPQIIPHKTKYWATGKIGAEFRCSERVDSSCSTTGTHCVTVKWYEYHLI
jgi:hypothetical protein